VWYHSRHLETPAGFYKRGCRKEKIRADLKRYISKQTQKRPLIMPVILEIWPPRLGSAKGNCRFLASLGMTILRIRESLPS
jgi:hypothetical protein